MNSTQLTEKIETIKARIDYLLGMRGDCTINQRKAYDKEIAELKIEKDILVTERMNVQEEEKTMITIQYTTHTVKTTAELDSLAFCCLTQDYETLQEIQNMLGDDTITAAIFDTSNGDYDNLHIGHGRPSFQYRQTWEKVTRYDDVLSYLENELPHGSGIDGDWDIVYKGDKIECYNSYHVMTNGMYDGWVDFTVHLTQNAQPEINHNFTVDSVSVSCDSFYVCDDDGQEFDDIDSIVDYLNDTFGVSL